MSSVISTIAESSESRREQELREIEHALRGLQYGSVLVVVQDGVVVQVDRTEKRRLVRQRTGEAIR